MSYSHKKEHIDAYLNAMNEVFGIVKKGIEGKNIKDLLNGPVAHNGFQRLT
jgi:glutamate-1-semialdehyde 2,1-aminomutase